MVNNLNLHGNNVFFISTAASAVRGDDTAGEAKLVLYLEIMLARPRCSSWCART
jgi:hypothetical protein